MHPRPPTIALFGNFGTGNLGNDGSLEAMISAIRRLRPDADLTCICPNPSRVTADYGIRAIPGSWPRPERAWFRFLNAAFLKAPAKIADFAYALTLARRFDVVIMPGTGLLANIGEPTFGWPFTLFCWCLSARLSNAKPFFVSIGAGQIPGVLSRWFMITAARMALYRSFRDNTSRERCARFGLDTSRDAVYPDIAFGLPTPPSLSRPKSDTTQIISVGVMSYHGWRSTARERQAVYEAYRTRISMFVDRLLERGYTVRLIIGEDTDLRAVDDVLNAIAEVNGKECLDHIIAEPAYSLQDVMLQMGDSKIAVATRLHNVICALMVGRPLVCLGYSDAHHELMTQMGLSSYYQHVENFDPQLLIQQFDALLSTSDEHETRIQQICERYRILLAEQDNFIVNSLMP